MDDILAVSAIQLPLTFSLNLGALTGGLGCFPLDHGAYPP